MDNTKKNSDKKIAANHRYDDKTYDKILVRLPKGTKAMIEASGDSYNGFITKAVKEYCENHGYKL